MGQEASLPEGGSDDFEEQARAPPSSINPPPAIPGAPVRPGTKMINTIMQRATAGVSHQDFDNNEAARAAAAGGPVGVATTGSAGNGGHPMPYMTGTPHYANGGNIQQPQHQQHPSHLPHYPNLQQMTQEEQQRYLSQQKAVMMQQQQDQHNIMIHNQYPHHHHHPHHHEQHYHNQQAAQPGATQHYWSPQVGSTLPQPASANAGGGGGFYSSTIGIRKGGRGKALINSMKNLSIGNTIRSGVQATAHVAAATASAAVATAQAVNANVKAKAVGGVNEWETRWDEDDDDSDDGDEDENDTKPIAATMTAGMSPMHHPVVENQQQHQKHHHSPMRPGMDSGHSSLSPISPGPASMDPSLQATTTMKTQQLRSNVVTPIRGDMAIADDGVEWDTGAQQELAAKPNVQMFLPLLRVLGKGSFGKVVLVQKRVGKERGSLFAMKILRKTHLVKRRQIERTRTERKVLSAVNHPFIMKLHYAFQTPEKLYLVLDYCPGGELFFHLSRIRRFPERVARFYAAELLLAIGHLHKRGIIYRDLKPENVLLDADGHVKLGDFGLAKAGLKHPCEGATSMCGTPEYMAPEVLSQQGHGFCVDYWGLGMLVYEMMTGLPPWYTTDRAKLFRRLKSAPLDIPNYFSAQSANCVSALLERNPRRRLGVAGVRTAMEHDFFRNINWRALYGRRVEAPIRPCEGWKPPDSVKDEENYDAVTNNGSGPNLSSSVISDVDQMGNHDLEAATANFDNTFTRMPVHTEEGAEQGDDSEVAEQLNDDTFVGFTFDEKDREAQMSGRQRTYPQAAPQQPRTLD